MGDKNVGPACDLVLEGGVTSALIYTGLIARLSQHYRLKNLGGTSSGAVAAAAGAIAQRAKLDAPGPVGEKLHRAFKALERFPRDLARTDKQGRTVLFRLFQPQRDTRRGYDIVASFLKVWAPDRRLAAVAHAIAATVRNFPLAAALGALPGLWFLCVALLAIWRGGANDPANWVSAVVGLLLALGLGVLVAAVHALWSTLSGMVHNHFGLCSGMAGTEPGAVPPLTSQFHQLFNGLLGRDATKPPVTFGDLWGKSAREGGEREIDLQVITTALNLRRPFRLPNDPGLDPLRAFFYDAKEWGLLFPGEVMKWLVEHPRLPAGPLVKNGRGVQLLSLPEPRNLPVLVAVRLSLSFPGLLSAVPMYTVEPRNGAKPPNTTKDGAFLATKVYFSDGGITSNCPIHLFDVPLPGHPTFGVRLDTFRPGERGRYRVSLPDDGSDAPFDTRSPVRAAWQFVSGIVGTALDWRDRLQRRLPGYRERIVVVALKPEEGGLNLAMTRRTITRVAALGSVAARRLQDAFEGSRANGRGNAWDRHRWLRLHSTLAAAQRYATELHKSRMRGDVDYRDLLDLLPSMDPRLTDHAALAQAKVLLDRLSELPKGDPAVPSRDLGENAPQPPPRLRMSPPW